MFLFFLYIIFEKSLKVFTDSGQRNANYILFIMIFFCKIRNNYYNNIYIIICIINYLFYNKSAPPKKSVSYF